MDVFFKDGRISVVGLDPVECPVDVGRDGARDFEVVDGAFEAGGPIEALEDAGAGVFDLGAGFLAGCVVWCWDGEVGEEVCHHVCLGAFDPDLI